MTIELEQERVGEVGCLLNDWRCWFLYGSVCSQSHHSKMPMWLAINPFFAKDEIIIAMLPCEWISPDAVFGWDQLLQLHRVGIEEGALLAKTKKQIPLACLAALFLLGNSSEPKPLESFECESGIERLG
ncbi:MAG: hypothetical protein WCO68_09995 [Verrucomicrobiota bacterium]